MARVIGIDVGGTDMKATLFDGDVIFAVSTARVKPRSPMQVDAIAALVVPEAVERSVRRG